MKNKSARGRNDSCKSPETAIKKIKSRASKRVVSDTLCMIEERKREREKERTTIIYILSIDFLRCNENNHLTHIARAKL